MAQPDWLRKAAARVASEVPEPVQPLEEVVPGRRVLIDGDYLAYFASGGDDMRVNISRRVCLDRISTVREIAGAERAELHLTARASTKGERYLIATTQPYQDQRKGSSKPKNWSAVREFLETVPEATLREQCRAVRIEWMDREADDGFSLLSYNERNPVESIVHHTADKDMRMLPGLHIAWTDYMRTEVPKGAYEVIADNGLVFGHKWFWMQMLHGDTADHIPGLPRWGEAAALKALKGTTCNAEAYEAVQAAYAKVKREGWTDFFCEQAGLLWLRQSYVVHDFQRVIPPVGIKVLKPAIDRMVQRVRRERASIDDINAQTCEA